MGFSELLSILEFALPVCLGAVVIAWSLISSKLAWWIARTFVKSRFRRVVVWFLLWLSVMEIRVVLFFKVWRRGVGPISQYHAWRQFLRLVGCFVREKAGTVCFAFITLISNWRDEKINPEEFKIEDLAERNDECGLACYEPLPTFLKIVFTTGVAEQEYLSAVFSMIKRGDDNKFWGALANGIIDYLHKFDLNKAKELYIKFSMLVANRIMDFAKAHDDRDLALSVAELKQRIYILGQMKYAKRNVIEAQIDDIVERINGVGARLSVSLKFSMVNEAGNDVKLIAVSEAASADTVERGML